MDPELTGHLLAGDSKYKSYSLTALETKIEFAEETATTCFSWFRSTSCSPDSNMR